MIIAMILLAVPFIFGSIREGLGGKLILASVIGVSVYLLDQIIANAGLLLQMNPILISVIPSLILISIAIFFLKRVH